MLKVLLNFTKQSFVIPNKKQRQMDEPVQYYMTTGWIFSESCQCSLLLYSSFPKDSGWEFEDHMK